MDGFLATTAGAFALSGAGVTGFYVTYRALKRMFPRVVSAVRFAHGAVMLLDHELRPNGGHSMKDQLTQLVAGHKDHEQRIRRLEHPDGEAA